MMTSPLKDVLLIGYGAIGAVYSLILKNSGRTRVTVVARSNYEAVSGNGMNIQSRKYGNFDGWRPDRLFPKIEPALDRPYSYVVLATKAIPEIQRTPALLSPLLSPPYIDTHPQPTYVFMQNGLNVESDLYDALKRLKPEEEPRIIGTGIWIGTALLDKNTVEHNEFDRISMGIYRPSPTPNTPDTPEQTAALQDFASILSAGGSQVTVEPEMQRVKFAKNLWNGVFGASAALSRFSLREFFRPPHMAPGHDGLQPEPEPDIEEGGLEDTPSRRATREIPHAVPALGTYTIPFLYDTLHEVSELGKVLFSSFPPPSEEGAGSAVMSEGQTVPLPGWDEEAAYRILMSTARLHAVPTSTHVPSMLLDVQAGRPMEVEHVVGEVVRMGRKAGVSMPRMETLYALLLVMQNQFLRQQKLDRSRF